MTDTDALLATVRDAHRRGQTAIAEEGVLSPKQTLRNADRDFDAALDSLAAELSEWEAWSGGARPDTSPGDVIAAEADGTITLDDGITTWNPLRAGAFLAAELERVKAERDAIGAALAEPCAECGHIDWRTDGYADRFLLAEARLDKALTALRGIAAMRIARGGPENEWWSIARRGIAEIEGEQGDPLGYRKARGTIKPAAEIKGEA